MSCETDTKSCATCEYHDDFSWACSNGESLMCAEFTNPEYACEGWEQKDDEADERYYLTEWGCLKTVLNDYGINTDNIPGRVGKTYCG